MPYDRFLVEQIAGDEMDGKTDASQIATGFLRAGPRVLFREKDNPERRFDYLDDVIGVIGKGTLGLTIGCARCHDHKFDPIRQKDYYALQASIFGYVETSVPLAPPAQAAAYLATNEALDARRDGLKAKIAAIEKPHRDRLELALIKTRFSDAIYQAAAKPESARTPGEKLLAIQVFEAVNVAPKDLEAAMSPAELAARQELDRAGRRRGEGAPAAAADGRHRHRRRSSLLAARRGRRGRELSEVPDSAAVPRQLPAQGSRTLRDAAVVFPDPRRRREPRPADAAGVRAGDHPRQSAHRDPAARRADLGPAPRPGALDRLARQPAHRPGHRQSALAEALRPRHRLHARELRQDGRSAHASGAARLAGGRVHAQRLEPQAGEPADDDVAGLSDGRRRRRRRRRGHGSGEPLPLALPPAAPRRRDRARQHADRRRQHQPGGGRRADLPVHSQGHPHRPVPRQVGEHARRARRRGGAASTSIAAAHCRTRCSTPSTTPT